MHYTNVRAYFIAAPGKCDEFELVTRGANFLEVRWTAPSEPNGVLLGYELIYSPSEWAR